MRTLQIAEHLQIVEGTVKDYLTTVFSSLDVRNRTELVSELQSLIEKSDAPG